MELTMPPLITTVLQFSKNAYTGAAQSAQRWAEIDSSFGLKVVDWLLAHPKK